MANVPTRWLRVDEFYFLCPPRLCQNRFLNTVSQSTKMYKTVLCFEMSPSLLFSRLYGKSQLWSKFCANCLYVNVYMKTLFVFVDYTPKSFNSGCINRKPNKIVVKVRANRTTRSFRITLARALSWAAGRLDWTKNERNERAKLVLFVSACCLLWFGCPRALQGAAVLCWHGSQAKLHQ